MKYPSIYLLGKGQGRGPVGSFAGPGMHTDAGGKAIHVAPTRPLSSRRSPCRKVVAGPAPGPDPCRAGRTPLEVDGSLVALILDEESRSDTYPYVEVEEETAQLGHEASVSRVGEDELFYLMSRGLSEAEATAMVVNGFIEPIAASFPWSTPWSSTG